MELVEEECALCIIGAGYAGISALYAAKSYLKPNERVIVVDKLRGWGGQWLKQYDFVRLHQPYQHFTAGNRKWSLNKPPTHLASKDEILKHLQDIVDDCKSACNITPFFECTYQEHRVVDGQVKVTVEQSSEQPGSKPRQVRIKAKRLIKAIGFDIPILKPFGTSSSAVQSVSVVDPRLHHADMRQDEAPVYIVGSGKTAMDCAYKLIRDNQVTNRKIVMIGGRGTWFAVREKLFPTGWRRLIYGASWLFSDWFVYVTRHYDGTNEKKVHDKLQDLGLFHSLVPEPENFTFGIVSREEMKTVREGVTDIIKGHFKDVREGEEGELQLVIETDGETQAVPIERNAWIINCSGHIKDRGNEPILSEDRLVCSPQRFLVFSGPSHFIATHLFFLGKLWGCSKRLHWSSFEFEPRSKLGLNMIVLYLANLSHAISELPLRISLTMHADFNKWFPFHRQIPAMLRILLNRTTIFSKATKLLPDRYGQASQGSEPESPERKA